VADETLRFDIIGKDDVSGPFSRAGRAVGDLSAKMDAAAFRAKLLDEELRRQKDAARVSAEASLALARADKTLEEAEHGLAAGALEAEFALKREAEAARKAAEETRKAAAENKKAADGWQGLAGKMKKGGGPAWLGPALLGLPAITSLGGVAAGAGIGLAGAAVAGAAALAAFGAVARPVLAAALTAEQKVNTAQNTYTASIAAGLNPAKAYRAEQLAIGKAYADLSPQQIALSKQLGAMAQAWQDLKAAQTPVVAGALQPWLKSVTDLTKNLAPIIAHVSPVIKGLGTQFDNLINSSAFRGFRDFIAGTGSAAVSAAGSTVIDLVKSFMILLPRFDPLIREAVGWISRLGPAVLTWASSQKTADHIQGFIRWFSQNGPVVGGLLKNIGAALKALAPGLTAGGVTELKVISDFFGLVAKLPPGLAKPLAETAGALLLLNKLGVVKAGVQLTGLGGKGAAAGAAGGLWGRLFPGAAMTAGGALAIGLVVGLTIQKIGEQLAPAGSTAGKISEALKAQEGKGPSALPVPHVAGGIEGWVIANWGIPIGSALNKIGSFVAAQPGVWLGNFLGALAADGKRVTGWFSGLGGFITGSFGKTRHDVAHIADMLGSYLAGSFDTTRRQVAGIWDKTWANTITRTAKGFHDVAGWFDTGRHWIAVKLDQIRGGAAIAWDAIWNSTVGRARRGVSDLMSWVGALPGKSGGAFAGAGRWLVRAGQTVITGLWDGLQSVWQTVEGWFRGLPHAILHALGIASPPPWAIDAGKHVMGGLLKGLAHGAADVKGFFRGIAMDVAGPFKSVWGGLAAAGRDIWHFLTGGGGAGTAGPGGGAPAANAALARRMMPAWGSGMEWYNWNQLEMSEAGWNQFARNPSSGAYGIPQALPPGKMGAAANPPQSNPAAQISWMIGYIKSVYGDPVNANAHEQAFHWYDTGYGVLPPGLSLSVNATGHPEMLQPASAARGGRGGNTYIINISPTPLARPADVGRDVVGAIKAFEKGAGPGWRK
jgi:hypothetical protein